MQNIFIASPSPDLWLKIGDFGISKRVTDDTVLHTTKIYTRDYCAPKMRVFVRDRAETDSYVYTNAVDLWSLGIIVFEMLTKKRPFLSRKDLEAFYDGKSSLPIEALREKSISPDGIDFIGTLLRPRPHERPTAIGALELPWLKDAPVEVSDKKPVGVEADTKGSERIGEILFPVVDHDEGSLTAKKNCWAESCYREDRTATGRISAARHEHSPACPSGSTAAK